MRPLEFDEIDSCLLEEKPVLLLDTNKIAIRNLIRHFLADNLQMSLPNEIWLHIMKVYFNICEPSYRAVHPTSISETANGQVLHCHGIDLELGNLGGENEVTTVEQFLQSAHSMEGQDGVQATKTGIVYSITFLSNSISSGATSTLGIHVPDCLFVAITVPDAISWLDDGHCWVCDGKRNICPGCTGGVAQEFDAFMGCGVDLACPLCMGLDFMREDKEFLQEYYGDKPPAEEAAARKERVRRRMIELDYLQV